MKKIDALLKRVELFERLAVYGDRKSFLRALAQSTVPPWVAQTLESFSKDLVAVHGGKDTPESNQLAFAVSNGMNMDQIRQLVEKARDTVPGNRMDMWNRFNDFLTKLQSAGQTSNVMVMPEDKITGHRPAQFNPNVKKVQQFLNNEIRNGVAALPVQEDGKLGPDTINSLKDWAKAKNIPSDLNTAFQQALTMSEMGPGPNLLAMQKEMSQGKI